jgi:3-hydroxyisobutyrate dehydrogenase
MHRDVVGPIDPADGWWGPITGAITLGEKDLVLAIELAAMLGVDVPMAVAALEHLAPGFGVPHSEYHPSKGSAHD